MNILEGISSIVKPVTSLIDDFTLTKEEKLRIQTQVTSMENKMALQMLDYERELFKSRADIVKAEAQSKNFITSGWRPITALIFVILVVMDQFQLLPKPINPEFWVVIKIMIGGYVVGRSGEKVAKTIKQVK